MRNAEWSLILFTLLTQIAIGMYLVIQTVNIIYISKSNDFAAKEIVAKLLPAIVVVLILAIVASFFHIGKPKNAVYAVSHFSHSWLSREIAFLMLFTFLAGISLVTQHIVGAPPLFRTGLAVISCFIGIITIISMAKVYMLETVPVWNSYSTPIQFVNSSLILGAFSVIFLFALFGRGLDSGAPISDISKILLPVLLFLIAVNLITLLIHLFTLHGAGIAGLESFKLLTENHVVFLFVRVILILIAIILFCILLFADTKSLTTHVWIILGLIVFISEIIGRYLFYASYSRVGI